MVQLRKMHILLREVTFSSVTIYVISVCSPTFLDWWGNNVVKDHTKIHHWGYQTRLLSLYQNQHFFLVSFAQLAILLYLLMYHKTLCGWGSTITTEILQLINLRLIDIFIEWKVLNPRSQQLSIRSLLSQWNNMAVFITCYYLHSGE